MRVRRDRIFLRCFYRKLILNTVYVNQMQQLRHDQYSRSCKMKDQENEGQVFVID